MFDPYHKWLGIPPKDQPPNHYRLLGIELFEADPDVIDAAADRQMAYVQKRATGEYVACSQKLLNEMAAARLCLLNPEKKAKYDAELRKGAAGVKQSDQTAAPAPQTAIWDNVADIYPELTQVPANHIPASRKGWRVKPWHVAVLTAGLLVLGGAMLVLLTRTERTIALSDPSGSTLAVNQDASPAVPSPPPPTEGAVGTAVPDTKDPDQASHRQLPTKPVATYTLEIDPPTANLAVKDSKGTVSGVGQNRQITIDEMPVDGSVLVIASAEGYQSSEQRLTPTPGKREKMWVVLEKIAEPRLANGSQKPTSSDGRMVQGKPSGVEPKSDAPAIYNVTISPSNACLEASYDKVTFSGGGPMRQVVVTSMPPNGYVRLTASYPGFKSVEEWLTPSPGLKAELSIELKESGETTRASNRPQVGELRRFRAHTAYVTHVAISPDGRFVASGGNDRTVRLRDLNTGDEIWKYSDLSTNVFALSFSPEGNRVWVCSRDAVKRLDTANGSLTKEFSISPIKGMNLGNTAFGLGCSRLAVHCEGEVRIYDVYRKELRSRIGDLWTPVILFSPDGTRIVAGGNEGWGKVVLGNPEGGKLRQTFLGLRDRTTELAFSPDSKYLAASSGPALPRQRPPQNKVIVWELSTGRAIQEWTVSAGWQWALAFSPDSRLLIAGGSGTDEDWFADKGPADKAIRVWDVATGREVQRLTGHTAAVLALAVTPDGRRIVSGSADGTIRVWHLPD